MPDSPDRAIELNNIDHGAMFKGSKGYVIADFNNRMVVPIGDAADLTYYQPRKEEELIPRLGHFQKQWINACKTDLKTSCDFKYSSDMIEHLLLGLAAYRHGGRIEYDPKKGRITNSEKANELLKRPYRDGWSLKG